MPLIVARFSKFVGTCGLFVFVCLFSGREREGEVEGEKERLLRRFQHGAGHGAQFHNPKIMN